MDPSIFLQYSPPNGLPQESKLATYMTLQNGPVPQYTTHYVPHLSVYPIVRREEVEETEELERDLRNRSTSTPTRSLNQAMGKLSLESSPTAIKKC